MTHISSRATQARENARASDGKFGHQAHDRADGINLDDDAADAARAQLLAEIEALPYPIDDLSTWHQVETGHPADFEYAYMGHFGDAADALYAADGDVRAARQQLFAERDEQLAIAAKRLRIRRGIGYRIPTDGEA